MSAITVMDLRRALAEYYIFLQAKFFRGVWREERETMEAVWLAVALRGDSILSRADSPVHVTASAIVMSGDFRHVLMNLHKRHGHWKHFGGHLESGDGSLAEAAMREVSEETGFGPEKFICSPVLRVGDAFDRPLDVFVIGGDVAATGGDGHVDIDVRYLFVTNGRPEPIMSEESEAVRWVPVDEAMSLVDAGDPCNIERLLAKARSMGGDPNPSLHRRMFGVDPGEASGFFGKVPGGARQDA